MVQAKGLTYVRRRRGTRAPCHRIGPNVTPTAPYALYASRGGGPGGLTIIAILDLLGGAAQCMVAAGPMHGIQLPATDATKCMALYGGLCANLAIAGRRSMHAFQPPSAGARAAMVATPLAGPATPSDGWGHPAMPESRLTGHSARARRR